MQNSSSGSRPTSASARVLADYLLEELFTYGAFIFKITDTGSIYIHFKHQGIGKLRIGDHQESTRYGYRWQLRTDKTGIWTDGRKGHRQFYYGSDRVGDLVRHIMNYAMKIEKKSMEEVIHLYYNNGHPK